MKRLFLLFTKVLIAGILLFWLYSSGQINILTIFKQHHSVEFYCLLTAFICFFFLTQSYRWQLLLCTQKINIPFWYCFKLYLISQFFTSFFPGAIGGDISRSYYIGSFSQGKNIAAASTIFIDRILGLFSLLVLASFFFLQHYYFSHESVSSNFTNMGLCLVLTTCTLCIILMLCYINKNLFCKNNARVSLSFISQVLSSVESVLNNPRQLTLSILFSIFSSIFFIATFAHIGNELNPSLTYVQATLPVPFIVISNMLPVSPGGIGVGELTSSYLFSMLQITTGAETMLLLRIWLFFFRIPGGILFILTPRK